MADDFIDIDDLRDRLENLEPLLNSIGALLLETTETAFEEERFGDIRWPERYAGQADPFINIAGALADLSTGPRIKARRFDRRPALQDTGRLRGSFRFEVTADDTVTAGTTVDYAPTHHIPLISSQPVSAQAKENLKTVIRRDGKGSKRRVLLKLVFLLNEDTLETQVAWRPMVGTTDQTEADIRQLTLDFLSGDAA